MVKCPACDHDNADGAKFCEQCGSPLEVPEAVVEAEPAPLYCIHCGEPNAAKARYCHSCGRPVGAEEVKAAPEHVVPAVPERVAPEHVAPAVPERVLPAAPPPEPAVPKPKKKRGWIRVLLSVVGFAILGGALGLGFAKAAPLIDTYLTYSPSRMETAGQIAQELVDQVYPELNGAQRSVSVGTSGEDEFYVVDFALESDDGTKTLRVLVNKYLTSARALEYLEIGEPQPYEEEAPAPLPTQPPPEVQYQPVLTDGLREVLRDPEIDFYDDLSNLSPSRYWSTSGVRVTPQGEVELTGASPYATNVGLLQKFGGGQAFLVSARFASGSEFEVALDRGEWQTSDFRRSGIYFMGGAFVTNIWLGPLRIDEQAVEGSLTVSPNRWYGMLGAVDGEGSLLFMIWDLENPSRAAAFRKDFGSEAAGVDWSLHAGVDSGRLTLDDYYQISFAGFR